MKQREVWIASLMTFSSSSSWIIQRTWPYILKPFNLNFCPMNKVEKVKEEHFLQKALILRNRSQSSKPKDVNAVRQLTRLYKTRLYFAKTWCVRNRKRPNPAIYLAVRDRKKSVQWALLWHSRFYPWPELCQPFKLHLLPHPNTYLKTPSYQNLPLLMYAIHFYISGSLYTVFISPYSLPLPFLPRGKLLILKESDQVPLPWSSLPKFPEQLVAPHLCSYCPLGKPLW